MFTRAPDSGLATGGLRESRLITRAGKWRQQRGQAMVLAVVCLLVLCAGLFVVFDTGQTVSKKEQLVNAADAAAYSVAIEQARALNTAAYLNRAEVANQVAIAQIVSIQSYFNYGDDLMTRGAYALLVLAIPLEEVGIGEALDYIAAKMLQFHYNVLRKALPLADDAETVLVNGLNLLNSTYSQIDHVIFDAFAISSGLTTAKDVVKANTVDGATHDSHVTIAPAGKMLLGAQLLQFAQSGGGVSGPFGTANRGYTRRYKIPQPHPNASKITPVDRDWAGDRVAHVMMQARDGFSARRNSSNNFFNIFGLPSPSWLPIDISFPKQGSTDLVDYDRWVAVDSLGLHIELGSCGWISKLCYKKTMPIAFGVAASLPHAKQYNSRTIIKPGISLTGQLTRDPAAYHPGHGAGWDSPYKNGSHHDPYEGALGTLGFTADEIADDPTDELLRALTPDKVSWLKSRSNKAFHSGLQDYNDVAPNKATQPYKTLSNGDNDVGPVFTVYLHEKDNKVRTGEHIGMEGPQVKMHGTGSGGSISTVSSAQVYYDRPRNLPFIRRPDGKRELGTLFEPYWQVRLIDTPNDYKVALNIGSAP